MKAALAEGKPPELEAMDSPETFSRLLADVQEGIDLKARKGAYKALCPITLLAVADDAFSSSLKDFSAGLSVPRDHPFQEIYLISTNAPNSLRIFP
jgi:hypothetical protein